MTTWQTLFLSDDEATASCYGKSVRFFMKSGIYTGFTFWHPAKLVTECGQSDAWIMKHLGMDAEELLRLKQVSGLASLFADKEFSPADPEMV